jgi:hypothetical protein
MQAGAWDVLGELEFRHRGLVTDALWKDMQQHPAVARHVLNWLLDKCVGWFGLRLFPSLSFWKERGGGPLRTIV